MVIGSGDSGRRMSGGAVLVCIGQLAVALLGMSDVNVRAADFVSLDAPRVSHRSAFARYVAYDPTVPARSWREANASATSAGPIESGKGNASPSTPDDATESPGAAAAQKSQP